MSLARKKGDSHLLPRARRPRPARLLRRPHGRAALPQGATPRGAGFTASPWAYNGLVFCANEYGETFVVRAGPKFELLHTNLLSEDDMVMASPAIAGGRVFLRTDRRLYCLENAP